MSFLQIPFNSNHCAYFRDEQSKTFIKVCKEPEYYKDYHPGFKQEFQMMKGLSQHSSLFPRYDHTGKINSNALGKKFIGAPYIQMEYVQGISLNRYLEEQAEIDFPRPHQILSDEQMSRICRQVYDAISTLYLEKGVAYLDINPHNIIITDSETFAIKLIDFTFCYAPDNRLIKTYKTYNTRVQTKDRPTSAILLRAMMFFVIRLFYASDEMYKTFYENTLREFNALCNGRFNGIFNDVFENLKPELDSKNLHACGYSPDRKRHLELLTAFHEKLQDCLR